MTTSIVAPNSNQAIVGPNGIASRPWYVYLSAVGDAVSRISNAQSSAPITDEIDYGKIIGIGSVSTIGALPNVVTIALSGDIDSPGPTYYYGTNGVGDKGWYGISETILTTTLTKTVNSDGTTSLDLPTLTDAGGGSLLKFIRDSYGRVAGTSAATTDDLPEGSTNLYFTAARARSVVVLPVVNGDVPPVLVYAEDGSLIYTEIF